MGKRKNKSKGVWKIFLLVIIFIAGGIFTSLKFGKTQEFLKNIEVGSTLGVQSPAEIQIKSIQKYKISEADKLLNAISNPVAKLQTEGRLDSDPVKRKSVNSLEDAKKFFTLAYAYQINHDPKYLAKSFEFISSWSKLYKASGNPIDETQLLPFFEGYSYIRNNLKPNEKSAIDIWLSSIAEREMSSKYNDERDFSNWNSHRINIIGQIGFLTKNNKYIDYSVNNFKTQGYKNLNEDGSSYDFRTRDSLSYHCYNLLPLLSLAKIAKQGNINLYDYQLQNGGSLRKALHFLDPYINGDKKHFEFIQSKSEWDKKTASSGQSRSATGRQFKPIETLGTLESAYVFDDAVLIQIQKLMNNKSDFPTFGTLLSYQARNISN